jgi:hypothetical protein
MHECAGKRLRGNTLELASLFFNCDGLTEAALSAIVPIRKRTYVMTQ